MTSTTAIEQTIFRLGIETISKLERLISSPNVVVRGTSRKFKIGKKITNGKSSLSVYLYCAEKKVRPDWSQAVCASVKLLSFSDIVNPYELHIKPYVFDKSKLNSGTGFGSFIDWCELFDNTKGYVKDDKIILEFKVDAAKPNENFKEVLNIEQIGSTQCSFRVTVKSTENMMAVRSPSFELLGASLYLTGFRDHKNRICVRLEALGKPEKYPIDITMCLKLSGAALQEKCETKKMTDKSYFIMYFEEEWIKSAQTQNRAAVVDVTLNAKNPNEVVPNAKRFKTKTASGHVNLQCAICLESIVHQEVSFTPCGHLFCTPCITNSVRQYNKCPSCNIATTLEQVKRFYLPTVD